MMASEEEVAGARRTDARPTVLALGDGPSPDRRTTVRSLAAAGVALLAAVGVVRAARGDAADVASAAKRKRRGRRGPPGPPGPAITTIFSNGRQLGADAGSQQTATANCPDGQVLVGGGYDTGASDGSVAVTATFPEPAPNPRQYSVAFVRLVEADDESEVLAFAVCAPGA